MDIIGGHHSGQHRQRAIISCTLVWTSQWSHSAHSILSFIAVIVIIVMIVHCNDCAYCTLYTFIVIHSTYYILCITQPTSVNVSCDHIAFLRLLEIQSKVLAFLRSWRWGAAGFADLPLNLRFQSFFWQKGWKKIDFKASGCGQSFTGWPTVAVARLPPRLSKLRR